MLTTRTIFSRRHLAVMASGLFALLPTAALAEVPAEYLGLWSTDLVRCEQENGEVDVLEVLPTGLTFYEVGCELGQSTPSADGVSFQAQCYKGGSPMSSGTVLLHKPAPDKVDVSLKGFSWSGEAPESFTRCKAQ